MGSSSSQTRVTSADSTRNNLSYKYVVRGSLYIIINLQLISRTTVFLNSILGVNVNCEMSGKLNYMNCIEVEFDIHIQNG